jgi:hypothetical protein
MQRNLRPAQLGDLFIMLLDRLIMPLDRVVVLSFQTLQDAGLYYRYLIKPIHSPLPLSFSHRTHPLLLSPVPVLAAHESVHPFEERCLRLPQFGKTVCLRSREMIHRFNQSIHILLDADNERRIHYGRVFYFLQPGFPVCARHFSGS